MKKIIKNSVFALSFATIMSCSCLFASCDKKTPDPQPPETGYSEKTDLKYGDAIEKYKKTDFKASWIWTETTSEDSYVAFRKTFELDAAPGKVTAYASAESKYTMWVNGELTVYDGNVKRGATPYDSYYDTITIDNLKAGKNVIVFLVAYNGRSGDSSVDGMLSLGEGETQGGLLFEMQVGDKLIKSDHTFKAMRLKEYKNRVLLGADYPGYTQSSMIAERNLYYDARDSVGDYTSPDFDDSSWDGASLIAKAGALPFGDLYDSGMPLMYFGDITDFINSSDYINSVLTSDSTIILDLPENMQFSAYFELEADAGKKIIYYTDTYYPGGTTAGSFKDTYVTASGRQKYESYPWRSGQKLYIDVEAGVKFTKIAYRPSGYDSEITSSFSSSDEELNILWQKCANTLKICMRDSFMDCPERERGPYMGDATNEMDISYYAMDTNSLALVKKAILSCVAWTGQDSLIPSRAPSSKPHEIPVQSLAFSTAVYNYWMQTGDKESVSSYYEALSAYLKVWKMKDNGMIETRAGEWNWSDWGDDVDTELLQICWYYYSMSCAKNLAEDLNKTSDISFYDERMSSMKSSFRSLYLKEDGFKSGRKADDRANALAVLSGLVGEEDYPVVLNVLKTTQKASPYMERFVLETLCMMGEYETALNRMKERYSDMTASDDSTVWELFGKDGGTINHGWSGGPLMIMSKYFAGIKPLKAGYSSYEIAPQYLFDSLKTNMSTLKGEISVEYVKSAGGTKFTVTTIDGEGYIKIPFGFGKEISGSGFEIVGEKDGCTVLKITKAGTYAIDCK